MTITENSLIEFSNYSALTESILAYDFPKIGGSVVLDHYTTGTNFRSIMESKELRLAPITLRLGQGELDAFAHEHELRGYVDANGRVQPTLAEAAKDLFYTSFAEPSPNETLWRAFGDGGNGYRLRFEISPDAAELREIRYHGAPTLLKQVNQALVQAGLPRFVLKGVSRIGAFYLTTNWQREKETRLLAKRFDGGGAPVVVSSQYEYWPVPIGKINKTADLRLLEVGIRKLDKNIVASRFPSWCSGLPLVVD
jgi:hypothetical protein